MRKKSFRLLSVLLSVFLIVTMVPTVVFAGDTDPIEITTQPQNISGAAGEEKVMSVVATNATSYSWQRGSDEAGWANIGSSNPNYKNAKTANLTITVNKTTAASSYRCVIKNSKYTVESSVATVTLDQSLAITTQPKSISGSSGDVKTIKVKATGATSYEWFKGSPVTLGSEVIYMWEGNPIEDGQYYSGANTDALTVTINETTSRYAYRCSVKNGTDVIASDIATVTLLELPVFSNQFNMFCFGVIGESLEMSVSVTNATSYQWQRSSDQNTWQNISEDNPNYSGAKTTKLTIQVSKNTASFTYRCRAKNSFGSAYSGLKSIALVDSVAITEQPQDISGESGEVKTMSVVAENATSYQWQRSPNGISWSSLSDNNLNYGNTKTADLLIKINSTTIKYYYRCLVKNAKTSAYSDSARVSVNYTLEFTEQPQDTNGRMGETVTLSVTAKNAVSYQWQRASVVQGPDGYEWTNIGTSNTANYQGMKTRELGVVLSKRTSSYVYRCVVKNPVGETLASEYASVVGHFGYFVITWDGLGGHLKEDSDTTTYQTPVEVGQSISEVPVFEREHYTFAGWYYATETGGYAMVDFQTFVPTKHMTLFAAWEKQVRITYHANGGYYDSGLSEKTLYVKKNSCPSMAINWEPSRPGYAFDGWYFDEECTVKVTTGHYAATVDTDFYAKWTEGGVTGATITWDGNGGYFGSETKYKTTYTKYVDMYSNSPHFRRDGYIFEGWYYNRECTRRVNWTTFEFSESVYLYANWVPDDYVRIYWDCKGGYLSGDSEYEMQSEYARYVELNSYCSTALPATPVRPGYIFTGWCLDWNCTISAPSKIYADEYIFLYASWTQTITVTWNCNGGYMSGPGGNMQPVVVESAYRNSGLETVIWAKTPTTTANKVYFAGWYYDQECTQPVPETVYLGESTTFYAKWVTDPERVTVYFDANGGTIVYQYLHDYEEYDIFDQMYIKYSRVSYPFRMIYRSGYTFEGWYLDQECTRPANLDARPLTENVTVYAKWVPVTN